MQASVVWIKTSDVIRTIQEPRAVEMCLSELINEERRYKSVWDASATVFGRFFKQRRRRQPAAAAVDHRHNAKMNTKKSCECYINTDWNSSCAGCKRRWRVDGRMDWLQPRPSIHITCGSSHSGQFQDKITGWDRYRSKFKKKLKLLSSFSWVVLEKKFL